MKYEADIYQMIVEDHSFWVAESKVLKGCVGQGDTSDEAIKELEQNEIEWLETAAEMGIPIPQPITKNVNMPSGKFALRLSPYVYAEASDVAGELGISLNQYFNNAIVNYNAESKNYLRKPVMLENFDDSISGMIEKESDLTMEQESLTGKDLTDDISTPTSGVDKEVIDWSADNGDEIYSYDYRKNRTWLSAMTQLKIPFAFSNSEIRGEQNEDNLFVSINNVYSPFEFPFLQKDIFTKNVGCDESNLTWYGSADDGVSTSYGHLCPGMVVGDFSFSVGTIINNNIENGNIVNANTEVAWLHSHSDNYNIFEAYAWQNKVLFEAPELDSEDDIDIIPDTDVKPKEFGKDYDRARRFYKEGRIVYNYTELAFNGSRTWYAERAA